MGRARIWVGQYWPCLAAILLLWSTVAAVLILSLRMNQGRLVYTLDDSYILMAMARNFALHGVWGMTPFQFAATSSAPLWTFLVACLYWLFGVHTSTPLILNLLFATLLVLAVRWILLSLAPSLPGLYVFGVLICILFFSPVPNLIFIGLEHTLHTLVTLLFVFRAGRLLADKAPPSRPSILALIALGVATGAARYEGLFAVAVVAGLLFLQRRVWLSAALVGWSLLPAFIMGAVSVWHGWFWLPNSVMLKGNIPLGETNAVASFLAHAAANTVYTGMRVVRLEAVALLLMLWLYSQSGRGDREANAREQRSHSVQIWMLGIFAATGTLHIMLARMGWFYRYEAYLVALGLTAVAVPLWEFAGSIRRRRHLSLGDGAGLAAVALLIVSVNLFWRVGYDALRLTPLAMHDTFRWHYQMGLFVRKYYQGSALVVNDIGAVNFMADIHLTDPHGLADREIAHAMLRGRGELSSQFLDQLARSRGATVALVDDNWLQFYGGVPRTWLFAGVWRFQNRVVLAPPGLSFYALNENAKSRLMENLSEFSPLLPTDVEQSGPYTQDRRQ